MGYRPLSRGHFVSGDLKRFVLSTASLVERTRLAVHKQSFLTLLTKKLPPRDKNKRNLLQEKWVHYRQDFFCTPTWPPFHCFVLFINREEKCDVSYHDSKISG